MRHPRPRQSGKLRSVSFRWACDKQLRDAVTDFAGDSRRANPRAADLYDCARARGHDHPHAVRILARAWLFVIWHCWHDHTAYDPTQHRALQRLLSQINKVGLDTGLLIGADQTTATGHDHAATPGRPQDPQPNTMINLGYVALSLASTLQAFFTDRLIRQRHSSRHTIAAYRDTLRLLLGFASQRTRIAPVNTSCRDSPNCPNGQRRWRRPTTLRQRSGSATSLRGPGMGERVRFDILGPLRCYVGTHEVSVVQVRERALLAMLLLHAGEPVPTATLVDAVWGELLPRNAKGQLHSSIWRLRRLLVDAGGSRQAIVTDPIGYKIEVVPEDLDLRRFRRLRDNARAAVASDRNSEANDLYRAALALWRGPALAGIDNPAIRDDAAALDEEHAQTLEECIDTELGRGKGGELVPELTRSVRRHPYRERLHGALMLALYRAGRQADALAAYQRTRRLVRDNLGIELGDQLQDLHRAILNRDPRLNAPQQSMPTREDTGFTPATPRMLPPDTPDFVGRESEGKLIKDLLTQQDREAVRIAVIAGPAGVGKTALSLHLAHHLRPAYPDGQLFVNLRGFDQHPAAEPFAVLGRFLRSLGVHGTELPGTRDERADLYRDLLAGRRTIVVLDNAASDRQIADLLPGDPACGVIINSRTRIGGSFGATPLNLDVLDNDAARALVTSLVGVERTAAEPDAIAITELIRLCGHLPLAIRIATGKLITKPHWKVSKLVRSLRDEHTRLDNLSHGQLDLRASIRLSYGGLSNDAQCLLRRLGDVDLPEISSHLSAALLNSSFQHAEEVLEQLHEAQLVEVAQYESLTGTRYRLHDLVRLFAIERAKDDEPVEHLNEARLRAFGGMLTVAEAIHRRVFGGHETFCPAYRWPIDNDIIESLSASPAQWLEEERPVLIAAIRRAVRDSHGSICWGLASAVTMMFQLRGYYDDIVAVLEVAREASQRTNDRLGTAAILYRIGTISMDLQAYEGARSHFEQAIRYFEQAGSRHGIALATAYLATVDRWQGKRDDAFRRYMQVVPELHATGDMGTEALALRCIGQVYLDNDDLTRADAQFSLALRAAQACGSERNEAQVLFWQGMLRIRQRLFDNAIELFSRVLSLAQAIGDKYGEAQALRGTALCHRAQGDESRAQTCLRTALALVRQPRPTFIEAQIQHELTDSVSESEGDITTR